VIRRQWLPIHRVDKQSIRLERFGLGIERRTLRSSNPSGITSLALFFSPALDLQAPLFFIH
jgi:hypothetical protein